MGATPKIRLAFVEIPTLLLAWSVLSIRMLYALLSKGPWNMLGNAEKKRRYWRGIALAMIRTGGYWFSIRHLQFMMPNTGNAIRTWALMYRTKVHSEEVALISVANVAGSGNIRRPWVHWIGAQPTREDVQSGKRVLLYIHGGGFVLPCSTGHISMMVALTKEANAGFDSSSYLAIAEYTIAPYAQHPTQLQQCISIIHHLHTNYGIPSSSLVLAGDSCGGALTLSLLSHYLHPPTTPSPTLPPLPYKLPSSPPLAGALLISPWTSFATTSNSYSENSQKDTLPREIIKRFRDSFILRSNILPNPTTTSYQDSPYRVAAMTGAQYNAIDDPDIPGINQGAGVIRPVSSISSEGGEDDWWKDIGLAVNRILVTAGEQEGFRDDILVLANKLKDASRTSRRGSVEIIVDDSYHAVMVSDFSFPVPPGTLVANVSGWLLETLKRPIDAV